RFGLRDRDATSLATVLGEQQLSASLGSKEEVLALHQLVPAELLIIGEIHFWPDSIEIILQGKSTVVLGGEEVITLAYADVSGSPATREEFEEMVHILALRFMQQIPRVQGTVAAVRDQTIITNLGEAEEGVKRHQTMV